MSTINIESEKQSKYSKNSGNINSKKVSLIDQSKADNSIKDEQDNLSDASFSL